MSRDDIMLLNNLLTVLDTEEESLFITNNMVVLKALKDKVGLIVKQITTQEALNDIMLELNKLNAPEENK